MDEEERLRGLGELLTEGRNAMHYIHFNKYLANTKDVPRIIAKFEELGWDCIGAEAECGPQPAFFNPSRVEKALLIFLTWDEASHWLVREAYL